MAPEAREAALRSLLTALLPFTEDPAPPLRRAEQLLADARRAGIERSDHDTVRRQLDQALRTLGDDPEALRSHGEAMLTLAHLSLTAGVSPTEALAQACAALRAQARFVQRTLRGQGLHPLSVDEDELDALWWEARAAAAGE